MGVCLSANCCCCTFLLRLALDASDDVDVAEEEPEESEEEEESREVVEQSVDSHWVFLARGKVPEAEGGPPGCCC